MSPQEGRERAAHTHAKPDIAPFSTGHGYSQAAHSLQNEPHGFPNPPQGYGPGSSPTTLSAANGYQQLGQQQYAQSIGYAPFPNYAPPAPPSPAGGLPAGAFVNPTFFANQGQQHHVPQQQQFNVHPQNMQQQHGWPPSPQQGQMGQSGDANPAQDRLQEMLRSLTGSGGSMPPRP